MIMPVKTIDNVCFTSFQKHLKSKTEISVNMYIETFETDI